MVGLYEPYVEVCRRLAELSPCAGAEQKSLLVNSGAEAVENAVKIARAATGRPAVIVFDNSFHGRTLLTMTMTGEARLPARLRAVRAGGLPRAGAVPVPRHLHRRGARRPRPAVHGASSTRRRSPAWCSSRCRARAASSRCRTTSRPSCSRSAASTGSSTSTTRCRRASAAPAGLGDRALRRRARPARLGQVAGRRAAAGGVTGRAEIVDAVAPGGLGGTFGGNPRLVRGRRCRARRGVVAGVPRARARSWARA